GEFERLAMPDAGTIEIAPSRLAPPASLEPICSTDHHDRLTHCYGQSYPDYVQMLNGDFANAPDVVAWAASEADVAAVLDWAADAHAAVIPFGGGTSVVGGVEARVGDGFKGTVSLDLTGLDRVLEVDTTSLAARIQGGIRGPAMEAALREHGLTMRQFPQSFELATLGGMIATRSGGHYATLYTHIDDFVESVRCVTPAGTLESRRLPGSGAGPSPDRLFIGSEGALGVITEAWMRLRRRPRFRGSTAVTFSTFEGAASAVRVISQAGLYPANVRLLDAMEAELNGFGDGKHSIVVLGFESADHPVEPAMARALELCADHGGNYDAEAARDPGSHKAGAAGAWRTAFIKMPHFRAPLVSVGAIHDTFETAITWDRLGDFHAGIMDATHKAIEAVTGRPGYVSCRFTHVYPDGPAPYYTFVGQGRHGALLEQWNELKTRVSDAVIELGGTITHHHAVGRDHMPWYERQRPDLFGEVLGAAKARLDPAGVLNPGVLLAPH
ncbi:MAG: FAD-binding oxidoreductase, partial [Hyphomicrobiales bacterium]